MVNDLEWYRSLERRFVSLDLLQKTQEKHRFWAFNSLARRYMNGQRWYHTLHHVKFCLKIFDEFIVLSSRPSLLELAIWYHDSIYNFNAPARQNEQRSAALARSELTWLKLDAQDIAYVERCILATTHDHEPVSHDSRLIVDIDLVGLGMPWSIFL